MIDFDHISFPLNLLPGVSGGPTFPVTVLRRRDFLEYRVSSRKHPVYTFDVSPFIDSETALQLTANFYAARLGSARGFRFRDPTDFSTANDDVSDYLGTDQPVLFSDGQYRTFKTYSLDGYSYTRRIFKPRRDSFSLTASGSLLVQNVDYTINDDFGIITFPGSAPTGLKWGGYFDVPVRFSPDLDSLYSITWEAFREGSISVTLESLDCYEENPAFGLETPFWPIIDKSGKPTGTGAGGGGVRPPSPGGGSIKVGGSPEADIPPEGTPATCGTCMYYPSARMSVSCNYVDSGGNRYEYAVSGLIRQPGGDGCSWSKSSDSGVGNLKVTSSSGSVNNVTISSITVGSFISGPISGGTLTGFSVDVKNGPYTQTGVTVSATSCYGGGPITNGQTGTATITITA